MESQYKELLLQAIAPVIGWYQGDEGPPRSALSIVRDIVSDLQEDRRVALVARSSSEDALAICHQIERCGSSVELTEASVMASNLAKKLSEVHAHPPPPPPQKDDTTALSRQIGGDHYKALAIQPIDFIHANNLSFLEGCVVKRICRHRRKNGREDIEKAIHELQILLEKEYPV